MAKNPSSPQNPDGYTHLNPAEFATTLADQGSQFNFTGNVDGNIEGPEGPWSI